MKPLPRIPFPLLPAGIAVALVLYACGQGGPGFGNGGTSSDDSKVPTDDTGGDTGTPDSTVDDTGPLDDTGDTTPIIDTSPPYTGEGYERGDVAYNLVAPDHRGNTWRLYQHGNNPVVVVLGYAQSYNFEDICGWLPEIEAEFSSFGIETAVMLYLDTTGTDADEDDASNWASHYGLSTVLYDPDHDVRGSWSSATQVKTYLMDRDMVIQWSNMEATSQEQLRQEIGDLVY